MGKRIVYFTGLFSFVLFLSLVTGLGTAAKHSKIAIFNFNIRNLEASGYGSTVTNLLTNALEDFTSMHIMDRKELEAFLSLNDLEQNDDLQNMTTIGSRLGLDVIVAGRVMKRGAAITVDCRVVKIDEKKQILRRRIKLLGDAALGEETKKLANMINGAIIRSASVKTREEPKKIEPKAPKRVSARPGKSRINLFWEDPPGFKAAGYKLYRSKSKSGPFKKVAQTAGNQFTDSGLEDDTAYYYKIKSYDQEGMESDFSTTVATRTVPTHEPPIILSTQAHVKRVKITWSPNPLKNPEAGKIKGYRIYRAIDQNGPYKMVADVIEKEMTSAAQDSTGIVRLDYQDRGLEDGASYHYKVTAYDENNFESDFSKPVLGATLSVVSGIWAQGDMIRKIQLKWQPAESNEVKGYVLYRSDREHEGFMKIKRVHGRDTVSYTDQQDLRDNTRYYYKVSLFEEGDHETSFSAVVSAKTKGAPPIPTGLKAESGLVKKVALSWDANQQHDVEGYKIYRSLNKAGAYEKITTVRGRTHTTYMDSGSFGSPLKDNTTYHYQLVTYNKVDVESEKRTTASARTKPRPAKPMGLRAEGLRVKEVPLEWKPNRETDISHYLIYRKTSHAGNFSRIKRAGPENAFVDSGLRDGVEYFYRIKAEDKDGLISDFSEPVTVFTKPKPRKPGPLRFIYEKPFVILSWPPSPESDIVNYNLYEKTFFGLQKLGSVERPEARLSDLTTGKKKSYVVTAVDKDGLESDPSDAITITGP